MSQEAYYTIAEAASILGEDQKRLERMVSRGIIKTIDLHGDMHISSTELSIHQHGSDFS